MARVVATTLRLWLRRRVLRVPDGARVGAGRWAGVAVVVIVIAGAAAVTITGTWPFKADQAGRHSHAGQPLSPVAKLTLANREAAAAWVSDQVAAGTTVGCDPVMCAALAKTGFVGTTTIKPGSVLPRGVVLLVTTAVLRAHYGRLLGIDAPATIASFGTGQAGVQVRVMAPSGVAAYRLAAGHALGARLKQGQQLATSGGPRLSAAARQDLIAGRVDPRLVVVLQRLLARYPVYVVSFGDPGPGAGAWAPLRSAVIGGLQRREGGRQVSQLGPVLSLLHAQPAPYDAIVTQPPVTNGSVVLDIGFPAPSPI
jgi:hypothetical protein